MTDYFVLLKERRRPWLEPESLKERFLSMAAVSHPDRIHAGGEAERREAQQRYTELNAAYNCLREPKARLGHFLELELGARPANLQRIPAELMDSSLAVSRVCREADGCLAEKAATTSPLLLVPLFEKGQHWSEELAELQRQVRARNEEVLGQVKRLDEQWGSGEGLELATRRSVLERLEELWRLLNYFARWQEQMQERIVKLAM